MSKKTTVPATNEAGQTINEKIAAKKAELELKHNATVHPILFYSVDDADKVDPIIGYIKEPSRLAKIRMLDKATSAGDFGAAAELLSLSLIKEESDVRIYSEKQEFDKYFLGACYEAQQVIQISISQFKKK